MHITNGYCYLHIQAFFKATDDKRYFAARQTLGSYPPLAFVLLYYLEEYPSNLLTPFPLFELVGDNLLHFPSLGIRYTNLLDLMLNYKNFYRYLVAGLEYKDVAASKLFPGLDLDLAIEKLNGAVMGLESVQNIANTVILQKYSENLERALKDQKIVIPFYMSKEDEKALQIGYSHYNLIFDPKESAQHSYAAASRMCENEDLLRMAKYYDDAKLDEIYDAQVIDVGGNWLSHFNRGRRHIHSCCPILDANDDRRAAFRFASLMRKTTITSKQKQVLRDFTSKIDFYNLTSSLFCLKRSQECTVKAPVCTFLHSTYDMTGMEIADCMDSHGSIVGYGTFIFSSDIIFDLKQDMSGDIPVLKVRWTKFNDKYGKQKIRFSFLDDSSWNYCHDYDTYLTLVKNKQLISSKGNVYYVELKQNINGVQYFGITRSMIPSPADLVYYHNIWAEGKNFVRIQYYEFDEKYYKFNRRRLIVKKITARAEIVAAVQSYALSVSETKFNVTELYAYTRAYVNRVVINGQAITNKFQEYKDDHCFELINLVQAIFISVYDQKFQSGLLVKDLMDQLKEERKTKSIFKMLYAKVKTYISDLITDGTVNLANCFFGNVLARKYNFAVEVESCERLFAEVFKPNVNTHRDYPCVFSDIKLADNVVSVYIDEDELAGKLVGGGSDTQVSVTMGAKDCISPDEPLTKVDILGDGHCQFNALGLALGKLSYRSYLTAKYKLFKDVPRQLTENNSEWGDEDTLRFIAEKEKVNICVHIDHFSEKFRHYISQDAVHTVHLDYSGNHYDALLTSSQLKKVGPTEISVCSDEVPPLRVVLDTGVIHAMNEVTKLEVIGDMTKLLEKYGLDIKPERALILRENLSRIVDSMIHTDVNTRTVSMETIKSLFERLSTNVRKWTCDAKRKVIHMNMRSESNVLVNSRAIEKDYSELVVKRDLTHKLDSVRDQSAALYLDNVSKVATTLMTRAVDKHKDFATAVAGKVKNSGKNVKDILTTPSKMPKDKSKKKTNSKTGKQINKQLIIENTNLASSTAPSKPSLNSYSVKSPSGVATLDDISTHLETQSVDDLASVADSLLTVTSSISNVAELKLLRDKLEPNLNFACDSDAYAEPLPIEIMSRQQAKFKELLELNPDLKRGTIFAIYPKTRGLFNEILKNFGTLTCITTEVFKYNKCVYFNYLDNDVLRDDVLKNLLDYGKNFDFIHADGCVDMAGSVEMNNLPLLVAQCTVGLALLSERGNFVIRVFDMFLSDTRNIIANTAINFSTFSIYRSKYSPVFSSEYYVVFKDKLKNANMMKMKSAKDYIKGFVRKSAKEILPKLIEFDSSRSRGIQQNEANLEQRDADALSQHSDVVKSDADTCETPIKTWVEQIQEITDNSIVSSSSVVSQQVDIVEYDADIRVLPLEKTWAEQMSELSDASTVSEGIRIEEIDDNAQIVNINALQFVRTNIDMNFYERKVPLDRMELAQLNGRNDLETYWHGNELYRTMWAIPRKDYEIDDKPIRIMRNSVIERIELWRINESTTHNVYKKFYSTYVIPGFDRNLMRQFCHNHQENFGLIDGKTGLYVIKPKDLCGKYEKGLIADKFVTLSYKNDSYKDFITDQEGFILVGNSTKLMQDPKLYNRVKNFDIENMRMMKICLVSGVPGCGKTFYIMQSATIDDLIVTTTKENCEDIKIRCPKMVNNVRTIHSVILHGYNATVNVMYVDEALMAHIGEIILVASKVSCRSLVLIGDEKQIPFISRNKLFPAKYFSPEKFCYKRAYMNLSRRVPLDVAKYYSTQYKNGFDTTNKRVNTVKVIKISNYHTLNKKHLILVFKQAEKSMLKVAGFEKVYTVHEYQGKQAKHITVYRDSIHLNDMIYESDPHILVALTRHTESFSYYTRNDNDKLSKIVRKISLQDYTILTGGATSYDHYLRRSLYYTGPMYEHEVSRGLSIDLPRLEIIKQNYEDRVNKRFRIKFKEKNFSIAYLQTWYDQILPGNSIHEYNYDPKIVQNSELDIQIAGKITLDAGKCSIIREKYDTLRPVLRTAVGNERPRTQKESLLAFQKRNDNVPQLNVINDFKVVINLMMDKFKLYIDPEKYELYNTFASMPIELNSESIDLWLKKQAKKTVAPNDCFLNEIPLTRYDFMIKTRPKVDTTTDAPYNYSALQTIAYHPQFVNQLLCPLFRDLKERLLSVLSKKFLIYTDIDNIDFADTLTKNFPDGLQTCDKYELDISKYDKSQGEIALEFDCAIMRKFGISEGIISLWRTAHGCTTLFDRSAGLKADVVFQRKSGDPFTFLGNTLHLMAVTAIAVDLNTIECGVFAGDDSVLFTHEKINMETIDVFQSVFNLEAKLFKRKYAYFCSKFLIFDDRWYFVPDLVKLVSKLGRRDLRNWQHAEEYRISLKDLLTDINNKNLMPVLNEAMIERYPSNIYDHSVLVSALIRIVATKENFEKLYFSEKNDKLCYDPSLPTMDW